MGLKNKIKHLKNNSYCLTSIYLFCKVLGSKIHHLFVSDKRAIQKHYFQTFGKNIDFNNPKTINEKIAWLKLNDRRLINTLVADKYRVRDYYRKNFGEEHLIKLLFYTTKIRDINPKNITQYPCIVKFNGGSGSWRILKDKDSVNWKELRNACRTWKTLNHYYSTQEWQYKNIKPVFIVEELLQDKNGHLPNDYKLHYINGKLEFVYCSIDREGGNYRVCYDKNWNKLPFTWVAKKDHRPDLNSANIEKPKTFKKMLEIGDVIAKNWAYVRVDFYECDGKLYYGEITLHHGSGYDTFEPEEYDLFYGNKLKL